ncbi:THMS2 protein, partial [Amia calva]|nr:THMS2 protein [Amia calva]
VVTSVCFSGSVYEVSGSEVCLSTGDLVKVIDIEELAVSCEDVSTKETFELPLNYKGLFKLVPEVLPFSTIEEIVGLVSMDRDASARFTFTTCHPLPLESCSIQGGDVLTFLSVESLGDKRCARCQLRAYQDSPEVLIPLSYHGEFYECVNDYNYSLQEIISSPRLHTRRFQFLQKKSTNPAKGPLLLSPIQQVQAIMHLRKNIVKFPSNLEVDVLDVTEQSQDVSFITPLSLEEVLSKPNEEFPTVYEILEGPKNGTYFKCQWMSALKNGQHLVLHGHQNCNMVLASSIMGKKGKQHFLISESYGGRLRRRPREFTNVYDLFTASSRTSGLKVNVTKHCESLEDDVPSLSVGETLEVLFSIQKQLNCDGEQQIMDVLVCNRALDEDDEDDEENQEQSEQIFLPMYLEGNFVEKLTDNKKYSLVDICKHFVLPMDVKVAVRDSKLEKDPLGGFSALHLEEVTVEPVVLASFPDRPDVCFELPTRWMSMSVSLTNYPLPWLEQQPPEMHRESVYEMTDDFYYEFRKRTTLDMPGPPRPPKRKKSTQRMQDKPSSTSTATQKSKAVPNPPSMSTLPPQLDRLTISPETLSGVQVRLLSHLYPSVFNSPFCIFWTSQHSGRMYKDPVTKLKFYFSTHSI